MERLARRIERQEPGRVAVLLEGVGGVELGRHRPSRGDLERAHDPDEVVGADARGGLGIDRGEPRVQRGPAEARRLVLEPGAERGIAAGRGDHAVEERAQVEPGAARDDGEPAARGDVRDRGVGERDEARRVHALPRLDHVEEVMGRERALLGRRLRGADVEPAVDLLRVGVHDLAADAAREGDGERRLAGRGRPGDDDEADHPTRCASSASATGVSSRVARSFSFACPVWTSLPPRTRA